jgi:hypothetical protein
MPAEGGYKTRPYNWFQIRPYGMIMLRSILFERIHVK